MARPEIIKTPLGQRLRAVRKHFGDPSRLEFAKLLGVTDKTLANHERGDSVPDASVLACYHSNFGVNITWLVTGSGLMFDDPAKVVNAQVDFEQRLMERMARVAVEVHRSAGIKLQPTRLAGEAAVLFNEMRSYGINLSDEDDIEANIPRLRLSLKRRLEQAAADPMSGKYLAS